MERRRRTAPRLAGGLLACAVVPAMLLTGCSSGSGGSDASDSSGSASTTSAGASGSTSAEPTLAAVKYATLPDSCKAVTASTVAALVPKAKSARGTAAKSSDPGTRGGCSWTGNGSDGYQYRWLSVTLQRFPSDPQLGSGEKQAQNSYTQQAGALGRVKGATTSPLTVPGDQAVSVAGLTTVAKVTSQNDTVIARSGNVVVLVEYSGAGLVGKKNPSARTIISGAQHAAENAVAALAAANT
ncbi:DUF3558 family protein [Streptomyces sp. V4-01]|uniref:DUF3558 family protein n=1 Tax=Actinacidiphila polyblastidii TaxID=3110430 RepID=A0ABU7PA79_9ACTN|nr:DUF3558 family protein [Streptomyces sp. V4-01]